MERKLIKLKNEIKEMSFEEVVEQFDKYLRSEAWKYRDSFKNESHDDIYQLALIGLWKAYKSYNYSDNDVLFFTYLVPCVSNEIRMEIRKIKRHDNNVSLASSVCETEGKELLLEDTLIDNEFDIETGLRTQIINNLFSKLNEKGRDFVLTTLKLNGKTQDYIAKKYNMSQSGVCRIAKKKINLFKIQLIREGLGDEKYIR